MIECSCIDSAVEYDHFNWWGVGISDAEYLKETVLVEANGGIEDGIVSQFLFGSHKKSN